MYKRVSPGTRIMEYVYVNNRNTPVNGKVTFDVKK